MDDVVVHGVGHHDQVPDVLGVERDLEAERVFDGSHGSDRVNGRAHAAEALGEEPRVARVAAEQDRLDPAEHLARGPGLLDLASVDLAVDAEMPLDARDRVDHDSFRHLLTSILCAVGRGAAARR